MVQSETRRKRDGPSFVNREAEVLCGRPEGPYLWTKAAAGSEQCGPRLSPPVEAVHCCCLPVGRTRRSRDLSLRVRSSPACRRRASPPLPPPATARACEERGWVTRLPSRRSLFLSTQFDGAS